MIRLNDLNPHGYIMTQDQRLNLVSLCIAMTKVEALYEKPLIITSGLRSLRDQERIDPEHMNSCHRLGLACDVLDPESLVFDWCIANLRRIVDLGLYLEDKAATPAHTHFQLKAPKSGSRVFKP